MKIQMNKRQRKKKKGADIHEQIFRIFKRVTYTKPESITSWMPYMWNSIMVYLQNGTRLIFTVTNVIRYKSGPRFVWQVENANISRR